jgi:glycerol-3-phosphate acyltransferase PlsY
LFLFVRNFISQNITALLLSAVFSYFLGSLNFALVISRYFKKEDIRCQGSGNAGFTNMLRCWGVMPAVVTFVGDFFKCLVAVLVSKYLFTLFGSLTGPLDDETMFIVPFLAGMFCVLGHIFPIYFGFKGGKGVVTASAMLLMSSYKIFLVTVIVFLLVFAFSKIVSLSAITAALTSAIATFFISYFFENNFHNIWPTLIVCVVVSVIIFRHRENIMRLIRGEEKKASIKKKEKIQEESPGI